ncbi:MAG: hypothetical protein AAF550_01675 [Myxococcota bacterium]
MTDEAGTSSGDARSDYLLLRTIALLRTTGGLFRDTAPFGRLARLGDLLVWETCSFGRLARLGDLEHDQIRFGAEGGTV